MRVLVVSAALLVGCSDLGCPDGASRTDGFCESTGLIDPDPKTANIPLGCDYNVPPDDTGDLWWQLTVNPGPIVAGEPFGALFEARALFAGDTLHYAQLYVAGGVNRVEVLDMHATVHVRRGIKDLSADSDVLLNVKPIPTTCRFDENGNEGPAAGPFPSCSEANDLPDGSNEDCTGFGGAPHSDNRCSRFVDVPTSTDCGPAGPCNSARQTLQCELNGFCVTGTIEVELEGEKEGYVAAEDGYVLFGWDDASTGATIDQTGGPNDGTWILPKAVFDDPPGPNAMRFIVRDVPIAYECTMGVDAQGPYGVLSREDRSNPAADILLISFPIQQP